MNVLRSSADIEVVTLKTVQELKDLAWRHPLRRARICLHHGPAEPTQEMVLAVHKSSYLRPHRHPSSKSESYHVIEGEMDVNIFASNGSLERVIRLSAEGRGTGGAFMYRITNGVWHQPVAVSEWVIYHETYTGPFVKESDVEYAPWAPEETWADSGQS